MKKRIGGMKTRNRSMVNSIRRTDVLEYGAVGGKPVIRRRLIA